jgi:hypothetical protein
MFLANTKVAILRGQTTDAFGDPVDSEETVQVDIPASISETRSQTILMSDGRPQQVRFLVGRLPASIEVREGDRIHDQETGFVYIVDAIDLEARSFVMNSGGRLDLRRVS